MDKWIVKPLVSVGDIAFGMERESVRKLFHEKYKEFRKTKLSKNTTDDFGRFHVYYNEQDKVDAVEIFEGVQLQLDGKVIFPVNTSNIPSAIPGIQQDGFSYTHAAKSIAIEANSSAAESILIGSEGYFG